MTGQERRHAEWLDGVGLHVHAKKATLFEIHLGLLLVHSPLLLGTTTMTPFTIYG